MAANPAGRKGAGTIDMRSDLVEQASKIIPDPPILINTISKRVKQLNMGRPPLVEVRSRMGAADVALQEIIEGKIVLDGTPEAEKAKKKRAKAEAAAAKG